MARAFGALFTIAGFAVLVVGCTANTSSDDSIRDAGAVGEQHDSDVTINDDAGMNRIRFLGADTPVPDGAADFACHEDTIFLPLDEPGCVARDIEGAEIRQCETDVVVAGQPVTILNLVGKGLVVDVAVLDVRCTRAECVVIQLDGPDACDCDGGGSRSDPWSQRTSTGGVIRLILPQHTPSQSLVVGGEGVRFRITACSSL